MASIIPKWGPPPSRSDRHDVAARISEQWIRHLRELRRLKERLESLAPVEYSSCSFKCHSKLEDGDKSRPKKRIDPLPRVPAPPAGNRPSLVSEVQTVYARLRKVEETCTHIEQGQSKNNERNPDLNNEQWEALQAIHRTLLREHHELPIAFSTLSPQLHHFRRIAHDHSLQSRSLRRFRRKYEDLGRKKGVTEEQGLAEPIFEFPNNIRHTCTTMPWTIFPALLVLWGVCWMFVIGSSQPEHEWGTAVDPMISPVPAAYDFYVDFHGIGIQEELQGSVVDEIGNSGHLSLDTLEELWPGDVQLVNDLIHPFNFAQNTPQDPNFLIPDMTSRGDLESLELAAHDTAETLPPAAMKDPTHTPCINTDNSVERDATGSVDSSGYGQRTINSDDRSEETKSCFVCRDCQQTFTRQFALRRHRKEKHKDASSLEESFQCPNTGCKRSGKAFKRRSHLKRHLENCKHNHEDLSRRGDQSGPRSASASTSASASYQHRQNAGPDEAIRANELNKKPRAEDDEVSNEEFVLAEILKKYKKMENEIKEMEKETKDKQDNLQALGKTIEMLKGSLRNS